MHGKIALDTDIAIRFLNGDEAIANHIYRYSEIRLPAIVVGELLFGALNSKHAEQNLLRHKKLINMAVILDVTEITAGIYAKTRLALKKKGSPIPENDLWIASLCLECGIRLFSGDSHFKHIDNLVLEIV